VTSLITGGAGFIGSHLAEALVRRGDKVIILDDLSTGSVENILQLRNNPYVHCVFESIMDRRLLAELVDESDIVFHLAAAVGIRRILDSPVRTIETNVTGTELVLEAAAKKCKLVFLASTSEVYGKNDKVPFYEKDDVILGPTTKSRWSYAASKALDEFLALAYYREKKLPVIIGRFFNTVGPRQTGRYGMVLPTLVCQALSGVPLTVFGTGKQSRCFGYVGDIIEAVLRLVATDCAVSEVVNIGSDEEISIEQLALRVKEQTESSSPVHFIPYDQAYEPDFEDLSRRVPSLDKLVRLTGFRPSMSLSAIIEKVVAHFEANGQVVPIVEPVLGASHCPRIPAEAT